jgi:hypothetical protein
MLGLEEDERNRSGLVSDVLACLMFVCAHGMDESELLEKNGNIS